MMNTLENAAQSLSQFSQDDAMQAADETAKAFEVAGERIAQALEKAAMRGELSLNALVQSAAQNLTRVAISELLTKPLGVALSGAVPVRGAEQNSAYKTPPITVNMNVNGVSDLAAFSRSQTQISTTLARAVSSAQRYL